MTGKTGTVVKSLGVGMAIGGAAAMMCSAMMTPRAKRQTKKNAEKIMKNMSGFVDSVQTMVK